MKNSPGLEAGKRKVSTARLAPIEVAVDTSLQVTRRILEYVLSAEMLPGARMPSERQFAEVLGVGRGVVRESLKCLILLGLVEVRQGDGTYLRQATSELLPKIIEWGLLLGDKQTFEIVEARQHLEQITASLAAERRSDDDLRAMEMALEQMRDSVHAPPEFAQADIDFHLCIAKAARNSVLSGILVNIQCLLGVWIRRVVGAEAAENGVSYREHVAVFEAIGRHDGTGAAAAMHRHLANAADRLRATLQP
jgi:GntR family transcriptional regulator, transcriptional repressor for pyruvate dehydrogenase complex